MHHIAFNGVPWTIASVLVYRFGIKGYRSYRKSKNPLSKIYGFLGLTLGTSLFFYGVPILITINADIIKYTYFIGDLFAQIAMQINIWLLWFIVFRYRVRLRNILIFSVPYSVILLAIQLKTSYITYSYNPLIVGYNDHTSLIILKSIIYIGVAWPLGFFFLHQLPSQPDLLTKFKSLIIGGMFILISGIATYQEITDKGADTYNSALFSLVIFLVFLAGSLIPKSKNKPLPIKS